MVTTTLSPKQIANKVIKLKRQQIKLNNQLLELQTMCTHHNVTKKFCGNTGNYDPSSDSYWIDWSCLDCGKRWTTDQSRENTLKAGVVIT